MATTPAGLPRIDRSGAAPFYYQLKEILNGDIDNGLAAGDKLPSESELCRRHSVSRTVVRQALDEMEREGLIYKVKGKGAFVTGRKFEASFVQHAAGFHAAMTSRGHQVTNVILAQQVIPAAAGVARALGLDIGEPVLSLDRVRSVDGVPIQVVKAWIPHHLCPGLEDVDLRSGSLYAVLAAQYGLRPYKGRRTISAGTISDTDAGHLGVEPGSPALLVESLTRTAGGTAFEYFVAVYRGDRSTFEIDLMTPEQESS